MTIRGDKKAFDNRVAKHLKALIDAATTAKDGIKLYIKCFFSVEFRMLYSSVLGY